MYLCMSSFYYLYLSISICLHICLTLQLLVICYLSIFAYILDIKFSPAFPSVVMLEDSSSVALSFFFLYTSVLSSLMCFLVFHFLQEVKSLHLLVSVLCILVHSNLVTLSSSLFLTNIVIVLTLYRKPSSCIHLLV